MSIRKIPLQKSESKTLNFKPLKDRNLSSKDSNFFHRRRILRDSKSHLIQVAVPGSLTSLQNRGRNNDNLKDIETQEPSPLKPAYEIESKKEPISKLQKLCIEELNLKSQEKDQ